MTSPLKALALRMPDPLKQPLQALWRRLPPRDRRFRLQDLETQAKREQFLASPLYQQFVHQEAAHWAGYASVGAPPTGEAAPAASATERYACFSAHPLVRAELHRRACGEEVEGLWQWIAQRYSGLNEALVLGAGDGDHCRLLLELGIARQVTAFDINEAFVRHAQEAFRQRRYPVTYEVGDLNFFAAGGRRYDLCLAMHALHHLIALERVLGELARTLAPNGGALICEEYVGPRYIEYPPAVQAAARELFARLPGRLRLGSDGRPLKGLQFADRWAIQRQSPFEAIRSDRILPSLERHFTLSYFREQGGGLLLALLNPLIHNFDPRDEEANHWLRVILDEDLRQTREGHITNFFAFFVAQPRAGAAAVASPAPATR